MQTTSLLHMQCCVFFFVIMCYFCNRYRVETVPANTVKDESDEAGRDRFAVSDR